MIAPRAPLLLLLGLLALPSVLGHGTPAHHEAHVQDVHYADPARRGEPAPVQVTLVNATNITEVRLIYCRVQHYACGPALAMQPTATDQYAATIPWTQRFFKGVTTVGVRIEMEFADGTLAHSPVQHYPERPADLPPEADTYYYYTLPQEAPGASFSGVLLLLVLAAVVRR